MPQKTRKKRKRAAAAPLAYREEMYTLLDLILAIEVSNGAKYDDPWNYGAIVVYRVRFGTNWYYVVWWGESNPEEMRRWSMLEHHYDRLGDRVSKRGWQLVPPGYVGQLQAKLVR